MEFIIKNKKQEDSGTQFFFFFIMSISKRRRENFLALLSPDTIFETSTTPAWYCPDNTLATRMGLRELSQKLNHARGHLYS